ncbi:hypothetical protein SSCG_01539 [Streptomyces clavuligerus]|nr:hypothetical protein SSCG_01539 [Streptomyces clavuligerus]
MHGRSRPKRKREEGGPGGGRRARPQGCRSPGQDRSVPVGGAG